MKVLLDYRKTTGGIRRYASLLAKGFADKGMDVISHEAMTNDGYIVQMWDQEMVMPYLMRKNQIEVYHCTRNFGVPLIPRVPTILTLHDVIESDETIPLELDRAFMYRRKLQLKKSATIADKIITVSKYSAERIHVVLNVPFSKIHVIPLGIDPVFEKPLIEERFISQPYILTIGGLNKRKNNRIVLEIFQELKRTYSLKHKLLIVGADEQAQREFRDEEDILLIESVSDVRLRNLYKWADVFIFLSLAEGFGIPPIEAMACGTPVICSNTTAIPEVVGNAALLVNPTNRQEIAQSIMAVLNNPEIRQDYVELGLERYKLFTYNKMIDQTLELYQRVRGK